MRQGLGASFCAVLLLACTFVASTPHARAQSGSYPSLPEVDDEAIDRYDADLIRQTTQERVNSLFQKINEGLNAIALIEGVSKNEKRAIETTGQLAAAVKLLTSPKFEAALARDRLPKSFAESTEDFLDGVEAMIDNAFDPWGGYQKLIRKVKLAEAKDKLRAQCLESQEELQSVPLSDNKLAATFALSPYTVELLRTYKKMGGDQDFVDFCLHGTRYKLGDKYLDPDLKESKPADVLAKVKATAPVAPTPIPAVVESQKTSDGKESGDATSKADKKSIERTGMSEADTAQAVAYVEAAANGKTRPDFNYLDFMLKVERADRGATKKQYKAALKKLRQFEKQDLDPLKVLPLESNQTIHDVRNVLVSTHLGEFRSGQSSLTETLLKNRGNCFAQSVLFWQSLNYLGVKPDSGQVVGINNYKEHVMLVVYDPKTKKAWNPLHPENKFDLRGDLYDPAMLVNSWLKALVPEKAVDHDRFLIARGKRTDARGPVAGPTKKNKEKKNPREELIKPHMNFPVSDEYFLDGTAIPESVALKSQPFAEPTDTADDTAWIEAAETDGDTYEAGSYLTRRKSKQGRVAWKYISKLYPEFTEDELPRRIPVTSDQFARLEKIAQSGVVDENDRVFAVYQATGFRFSIVDDPQAIEVAKKAQKLREKLGLSPNFAGDASVADADSKLRKSGKDSYSGVLRSMTDDVLEISFEMTTINEKPVKTKSEKQRALFQYETLLKTLAPHYSQAAKERFENQKQVLKDAKAWGLKLKNMSFEEAAKQLDELELTAEVASIESFLRDDTINLVKEVTKNWTQVHLKGSGDSQHEKLNATATSVELGSYVYGLYSAKDYIHGRTNQGIMKFKDDPVLQSVSEEQLLSALDQVERMIPSHVGAEYVDVSFTREDDRRSKPKFRIKIESTSYEIALPRQLLLAKLKRHTQINDGLSFVYDSTIAEEGDVAELLNTAFPGRKITYDQAVELLSWQNDEIGEPKWHESVRLKIEALIEALPAN